MRISMHSLARIVVLLLTALSLVACAATPRDPVPEAELSRAVVPGYSDIRYWGDDADSISQVTINKVIARAHKSGQTRDNSLLAISGGGSNGAFGAGLLKGWSEAGTRPEFTVVTGISTGSLSAPFAFLGKPYDDRLVAAYTKVSGADIYVMRNIFGILSTSSAADNTPLRRLVASYVTDQMVADIAREYAKGRLLLIGTTNLDAERAVVWDIGAIASSDNPGRKELIQDILVASAAISGVFPPVRIKVTVDGVTYDEMHVDGGTANQAFMMPSNFSTSSLDKRIGHKIRRHLYVIRNGKVTPEYQAVTADLPSVAGRSISMLIKAQGNGDLYRMYSSAEKEGIDFNAIWIPSSFNATEPEPFDHDYMTALFNLGLQMGRNGVPWSKEPPR